MKLCTIYEGAVSNANFDQDTTPLGIMADYAIDNSEFDKKDWTMFVNITTKKLRRIVGTITNFMSKLSQPLTTLTRNQEKVNAIRTVMTRLFFIANDIRQSLQMHVDINDLLSDYEGFNDLMRTTSLAIKELEESRVYCGNFRMKYLDKLFSEVSNIMNSLHNALTSISQSFGNHHSKSPPQRKLNPMIVDTAMGNRLFADHVAQREDYTYLCFGYRPHRVIRSKRNGNYEICGLASRYRKTHGKFHAVQYFDKIITINNSNIRHIQPTKA